MDTVTITHAQLLDLSEFLMESDYLDLDYPNYTTTQSIFRTYSGRGMYGAECLALTIPRNAEFILGAYIGEWIVNNVGPNDFALGDALINPRIDSMGMDTVVYWPSITVETVMG